MEEWRDIKGYEGRYQISSEGRVRSLDRIGKNGYSYKGKILKPRPTKRGYIKANLSGKIYAVHRLVAQAFIPNPNNYPVVNHKDENPSNNCIENLEWCDVKYNINYGTANKRIAEIGKEITKRYKGESVILIVILKGSIFFATELAKRIDLPMNIEFMSVSSYGSGTESSGVVKIKKDIDASIEGENVIIVEDIIDSGNTLSRLMPMLRERNPKSLTLCTLLDKPDRRVVDDVVCDFTGFVIPDKFVVGFGLDFDQRYRNLPYIGFVED